MRNLVSAAIALGLAGLLATAAHAGPGECTSTLPPNTVIHGDVTVPEGKVCTLNSVIVTGSVIVRGGIRVGSDGSQVIIGGDLRADHASFVALSGGMVFGSVVAESTTGNPGSTWDNPNSSNFLCNGFIGGNVHIHGSSSASAQWNIGGFPTCLGGVTVGGNLEFHNNAAQGLISGNTIGGNLEFHGNSSKVAAQIFNNVVGRNLGCQDNTPAVDKSSGGTNVVLREKSGECSGL